MNRSLKYEVREGINSFERESDALVQLREGKLQWF